MLLPEEHEPFEISRVQHRFDGTDGYELSAVEFGTFDEVVVRPHVLTQVAAHAIQTEGM
jgi:hypothetical protein